MAKTATGITTLKLALLTCLLLLMATVPANASTNTVTWLWVNIPTEGSNGDWVLANGSDIQHLTMAIDRTLYCYANPTGTSYTLFKSSDGYSWAYTGEVTGTIVAIAAAPDDARYVYYATSAAVYKSGDAGNTFAMLPANPGGAGSSNLEITSIDVAVNNQSNHIIACGTRDTDGGQYGGVYTVDESMPLIWTDTGLGGYDVYAVAFSPAYTADRELVAVVTDETDTLVTTKIGTAAWGSTIGDARLDRDNSGVPTPVVISRSAAVAFPGDYDIQIPGQPWFVAIDTGGGNGDVYRINNVRAPGRSLATDLNIGAAFGTNNIDVTSITVSNSATPTYLLAGAASSAQVYFSSDGGRNWTRATKEPTGQTKTSVVMATEFNGQGQAYAVTCGAESAFSMTTDKSDTWNQISLIDTKISSIIDVAPSPNYSQYNTLFLLTFRTGGKHSLWRSLNGGAQWERVYCGALPSVTTITRVAFSPQYNDKSKVVFITGSSGTPAVWQSTDNGQTFSLRNTYRPITGAPFPIDTWTVVSNSDLFIGSFDGSNGIVYHSTNGGFWYSTEAIAGTQTLNSLAISPDYDQDKTVLVGNTTGWVYWSNDGGKLFQSLPLDATSPPLTGNISVAFDPKYASNQTVYAASDSADKGIYRYIIGKNSAWERIDGTLPAGGTTGQLALSAEGTLYATNFKADGGLERCLKPTYPLGATFETVTRGLSSGATLTILQVQGNSLWSIDSTNTRVMTYIDSLGQSANPISPPNNTSGIGMIVNYKVPNISLDWEALKGATRYQWQLDYDGEFSSVPTGFEGTTRATSVRLPALEPATKYYWRVRADQPVLSPWSPTCSFATVLGAETMAPAPVSPAGGVNFVDVRPIFQWSAIPWAHGYELLVAVDAAFINPVIVRTGDYVLPATAWQCEINLNYNTTYYWKVRATGSSNYSGWSAVSAFTTKPVPTPPPSSAPALQNPVLSPPPTMSSPPPTVIPQSPPTPNTTPDWLKYIIGGLIVALILQSVLLLALVITIRRL